MVAATLYRPKGARQFQGLFDAVPFTFTFDSTSLADGAGATIAVTGVTGAALGDFVIVSASVDLIDLTVTAYVQAANTVEVRVQNEAGAARDTGPVTGYGLVLVKKAGFWQAG